MEPSSSTGVAAKSSILLEMERVITGIAALNRRSAYEALETAFAGLKATSETLSEAETSEFVELVHLVLLQFARGETIRVSGPHQVRQLDVCLKYNDVYEAALYRAMEFLARNLFDHIEEYAPRNYLRAALRVLGKEYYEALADSYHTDSIPEETATSREDEFGTAAFAGAEESLGRAGTLCSEEALTVDGPEDVSSSAHLPDTVPGYKAEQQMFYNWHEGNLSRLELMRLYGLTMERVNQAILRVACSYESGRHYGVVKWLIEMGEDGDIIWLLSKGMTAAEVGQKVQRNQWVVYKHRDAVLRRFQALRLMGAEGRAFCARLFGLETDSATGGHFAQATYDWAAEVGLVELGSEAEVPSG